MTFHRCTWAFSRLPCAVDESAQMLPAAPLPDAAMLTLDSGTSLAAVESSCAPLEGLSVNSCKTTPLLRKTRDS